MPRHVILACAFLKEAKPLISHFKLKQKEPGVYSSEKTTLLLTGKGKINAAIAVQKAGKEGALFLNVGVAGHATHPLGATFLCHKVLDPLHTFYPQILHKTLFQSEVLHTVDTPTSTYDMPVLYDMEATGFFQAALQFSPLEYVHVIKVVSDNKAEPFTPSHVDALMHKTIPCIEECIRLVPHLDLAPDISEELATLEKHFSLSVTEKHKLKDILEKRALFEEPIRPLPL